MSKILGNSVIEFKNPPFVLGYASVGGIMEKEGPLGGNFDLLFDDPLIGQKSWEKAESQLQKNALEIALEKSKIAPKDVGVLFAGDLLNQCISSTFGIMDFQIPFAGIYSACSTVALSLIMASAFIDGGFADTSAVVTSSHYCSAERQYRFPLEYGALRPPSSQWTATASGSVVLGKTPTKIKVTKGLIGKIQDFGITDQNNMGAAMAPAAADTILRFFSESGEVPENYDRIFTGDLGFIGSELFVEICQREGLNIKNKHSDCGLLIYNRRSQDVHSGGSGAGCSASVLAADILPKLLSGQYRKILFCATGALLSPTSVLQGENIPTIAHLVEICGI